jgi:hypothetical protein
MTEILPGLFIGTLEDTQSEVLEAHNITAVLSVFKFEEDHSKIAVPEWMNIAVDDDESEDILTRLPSAISFIQQALTRGNVLVHW